MQAYIEIFLDLTGNLATSITLAITIITSASLLLVNVARYFQAKKYGIPLNMVNQASLPDSLDLWVILISAFGFGRIIPEYVTNMDINIFVALGVAFISVFASLMLLRGKASTRFQYKSTGEVIIDMGLTSSPLLGIAIFSLVVSCLFMYAGYVNRNLIVDYYFIGNMFLRVLYRITSVLLWLYGAIITTMFIISIIGKLYGTKEIMTLNIDGHTYLLATRHSPYQWVLVPCTIGKNVEDGGTEVKKIDFIKGKFIIRDMSTLERQSSIVCRMGYSLFGSVEEDEHEPGIVEVEDEPKSN